MNLPTSRRNRGQGQYAQSVVEGKVALPGLQ
jgi:hypothetical protein